MDKNHRPNKLFKLDIEHGSSPPTLIFEEKDPDYHMSLDKSRTNNYIFINIFSHATSEVWYLEANNSQSECLCVFPRKKSVIYNVEDSGYKSFFIHSNENAVNFKVIEVPINNMEDIKEVIPHNPQVYCSEIEVFEDRIILLERENGLKRFRDFQYKENKSTIINVPEENCEISSYVNFDFNSSNFYFSFSSLITPPSVLSYNFKDQSVEFCKTKDIPYYDKSKYTTKRVFATGHDGVQIPISLVYSKDLTLDGNSPCYLYGYGSYGLNISPFFRSNIFSLIDRGFIYAIAHIRGSSTMGREWYENGKLQNKKNTFLDFIAAAEHLTSNNYTYEKGIVICGGSAGGMLVGTTANLRPELFKAVVAHVPFVDVLNTMLDETLPLTTIEYDEWGNPNNLEDFKNIKSYSTYDNVEAKDYPHMFITAGLNDPRVTYWEPAKWVAKLRELKTDKNVILLKTNLEAGHGGKTGRYESLKEYAQEYCFILVAFEMY